jgi:hypothetical protein
LETILAMPISQFRTSLTLIHYGIGLQLAGLLWGIVFPYMPYPRMGLTVHIQCMLNGTISPFPHRLFLLNR